MSENLVIYFSRKGQNYVNGSIVDLPKGNTEFCAEFIGKAIEGDVFKIETIKPYSENYTECCKEADAERAGNDRPELKSYLRDISKYDNVFICGPCWAETFPMAIFSQVERLDWKGKKVMVLVTHEGSGLGFCERDLKKVCKGASFGEGLAVKGHNAVRAEKDIAAWALSQIQHNE